MSIFQDPTGSFLTMPPHFHGAPLVVIGSSLSLSWCGNGGRMVKEQAGICDRWRRCTRALKREEQLYGQRLMEVIELNKGRNLPGIDDQLEESIFLVLTGLLRENEERGLPGGIPCIRRTDVMKTRSNSGSVERF